MSRSNRRNRGLELGVVLLLYEMMNLGFSKIPPITLTTTVIQILLYMGMIDTPWTKWDVCISADKILNDFDYKRLVLAPFEHGDDMHLYYNMASYLLKGRNLERRYGSTNYALFLSVMILMTSVLYVVLGKVGAIVLGDSYYLQSCAIGFSGVIFALKVVTSYEEAPSRTSVHGISVSTRYAAWVELVVIHLLVPRASFMGHLGGILAGVLYCYSPLGTFIDNIITSTTGEPIRRDASFYSSFSNANFEDQYYYNGY